MSGDIRRAHAGAVEPRRILMLVENLPCPFDRRVWQKATTLRDAFVARN